MIGTSLHIYKEILITIDSNKKIYSAPFLEAFTTLQVQFILYCIIFIKIPLKFTCSFHFQTSKLVLDEYFSGEPLQDVGQFYSFDSLPQPIAPTGSNTTDIPLSPPASPNVVTNGQNDDPPGK